MQDDIMSVSISPPSMHTVLNEQQYAACSSLSSLMWWTFVDNCIGVDGVSSLSSALKYLPNLSALNLGGKFSRYPSSDLFLCDTGNLADGNS